jgi:CBS domain-containing protein
MCLGYSIIESDANISMENAIREIMSRRLETVDIAENAQEAAKIMDHKKISSLLVVDRKKNVEEPIGIVTERDFLKRICTKGASSNMMSVRDIMSSPIEMVEETATIETAADLMLSNKIRHLLVIDEQRRKPIGIVAPSDLNKYLRANIDMDEVSARILRAIEAEEMSEQ